MKLLKTIERLGFLPRHKALELFPPFRFMGVRIVNASPDYHRLHATLPLRWYGKNPHGTMFGGFMCALADPLPALMCGRIFPGHEVWTKSNALDFLRPGKGKLDLRIEFSEAEIAGIRHQLETDGKVIHVFEFSYWDERGNEIARVRNGVYIRRRKPGETGAKSGSGGGGGS